MTWHSSSPDGQEKSSKERPLTASVATRRPGGNESGPFGRRAWRGQENCPVLVCHLSPVHRVRRSGRDPKCALFVPTGAGLGSAVGHAGYGPPFPHGRREFY